MRRTPQPGVLNLGATSEQKPCTFGLLHTPQFKADESRNWKSSTDWVFGTSDAGYRRLIEKNFRGTRADGPETLSSSVIQLLPIEQEFHGRGEALSHWSGNQRPLAVGKDRDDNYVVWDTCDFLRGREIRLACVIV